MKLKTWFEKFIAQTLLCVLALFVLSSCERSQFRVGSSEFMTVEYEYTHRSIGPSAEALERQQSNFISYEEVFADDLNNGTVQVVVSGVRIQSNSNNFEVTDIIISENDGSGFEVQDEFMNLSSNQETEIGVVLVLDMSTSLGDFAETLKEYAKQFIRNVLGTIDNSQVAVVFFSGKKQIQSTNFYHNFNADELEAIVDSFNDYQSRTALFQASATGLAMLDQLELFGTKALVVFTDGGDNDSDNVEEIKETIQESEYLRISIGLKGEDFDKRDLDIIADSKANSIVARESADLEKIFDEVARQVVSVYTVVYERSDQIRDGSISIKFEFEVEKIE